MGFQTLFLRFRYKVHFGIWKLSQCSKTDFPWNILILVKITDQYKQSKTWKKLPYKVELNRHLFVKVCWEISTLTQHHLSLHDYDAIKIIKKSVANPIAGMLWTNPIPEMGVIYTPHLTFEPIVVRSWNLTWRLKSINHFQK